MRNWNKDCKKKNDNNVNRFRNGEAAVRLKYCVLSSGEVETCDSLRTNIIPSESVFDVF